MKKFKILLSTLGITSVGFPIFLAALLAIDYISEYPHFAIWIECQPNVYLWETLVNDWVNSWTVFFLIEIICLCLVALSYFAHWVVSYVVVTALPVALVVFQGGWFNEVVAFSIYLTMVAMIIMSSLVIRRGEL